MPFECSIIVRDAERAICLSLRCDGDPAAEPIVQDGLREAMGLAWPLPRFDARDFAAAIVAAWKNGGGGVFIEGGGDKLPDATQFILADAVRVFEVWRMPDGAGLRVRHVTADATEYHDNWEGLPWTVETVAPPKTFRRVGWVRARDGALLLGGVKLHQSSPFDSEADARAWVDTICEGNRQAGRDVAACGTRTATAGD